MNDEGAFGTEEEVFAALGELESLSRYPRTPERWPPWERIRAALPPNCELPSNAVNVLVDLTLDSTGLVIRASVGRRPSKLHGTRVVATCIGPDGKVTMQQEVAGASPEVAKAVAAAHVGERFSPGERDGVPVPVRLVRVGVGIAPGMLRGDSAR